MNTEDINELTSEQNQEESEPKSSAAIPPNPPKDTVNKSEPETESDENLGAKGQEALKRERQERRRLEKELRALQQQFNGIDPSKYQEFLTREEQLEKERIEREQKALEEKGEYETLKNQLLEKITAKDTELRTTKATLEAEKQNLLKTIEDLTIGQSFTNALNAARVNPQDIDLLLDNPKYRQCLRFDFESKMTKVIDPVTGSELLDDEGKPISVNQWVETVIKPARRSLFFADLASGTGGEPNINQPTTNGHAKNVSVEDIRRGLAPKRFGIN